MKSEKTLTKSKFLNGLVSDALLWRSAFEPDSIPPLDSFAQQIIDSGSEMGELAKGYFEQGVDLVHFNYEDNLHQTTLALKEHSILLEAGFAVDRLFARIDILVKADDASWDIIEVKSSTKSKKTHLMELAFQKYVLEKAGLKIRNCSVMLINNKYERNGAIDLQQLFYVENLTEKANELLPRIPEHCKAMLKVLDLPQCPKYDIRDYKKGDHTNVFEAEFLASLPQGSVFELYQSRNKLQFWLDNIHFIKDLPVDEKTSAKHLVQKEVAETGVPFVNHNEIAKFIEGLQYPIHHLDFETFNPALPPFDDTHPYMQIPFQYSLHIEHEDGTIEHKEYLHTDKTDPRKPLFEQLCKDILPTGTILAYYETFEKSRVIEWGRYAPANLNWSNAIIDRMQDLLTPFKAFHYYHPNQRGSCSIKKVLPVMSDLNYDQMPIANGGEALTAYKKYFYNQEPHNNLQQLTQDMLAYCKQDTWAMVKILETLRNEVKQ